MKRGDLILPPDAPVLRPFRLIRFAAAWAHFVNTTHGEETVLQPTADEVSEWLADDDAAFEAERTKPRPTSPLDGLEVDRESLNQVKDRGWRQISNQAEPPDRRPDGFRRPGD